MNGTDGKVDAIASARKIEEHRANLERRLGAGDIRPATAEDYAFNVADDLKEHFKADDPMLKDFRAKAHEHGLSQKQFDFVISEYLTRLPELFDAKDAADRDACVATLKGVWKSDDEYKAQTGAAFRALSTFAGAQTEELLGRYGNDPVLIQLLARVGGEIKEDRPPAEGAGAGAVDLKARAGELRDAIAKITNRNDPQRAKLQGELDAIYAKLYPGGALKAGGFAIPAAAH